MKRLLSLLAAALLLPMPAFAGDKDDFGTWTAVNATANLTDRLKAQLWFEMRTKDGCTAIDCFDILPSLSYGVTPFLDLGFGAEFVDSQVRKDIGFRPFVTLHTSSGPLSVSLREMPFIEVYNDETPTAVSLRSSLKISYDISRARIKPYANVEVFTAEHWLKTRHYAGVEFGFGSRSSLDVFYMYYTFADKTWQRHLLGVTYNVRMF